ncbi:response regulator transcription factor [Trichlorobacter lovleyi]|uniref:Two component transcriptional regulator, LuxR family n=3 Tax=Trichlorobacter lovleyi TaxID=313985 RepID=B3E9L1_TRIL1|nr:response regulator transcription factor [Trichlorobacter lovleyi]ACD95287.1 two component transcriptional regulator, LuxR family [Trichlorobacter lovleyi SZ]QOX78581.1 response regulator transcription factor [Trichlorobacter lovleyi]
MELETNSKKTMKTILIIDDHTMFRQALRSMLMERMPAGTITCDDAGSAAAARDKLAHQDFDLIVLDIGMLHTNGMELLPELKSCYPALPVLMLSMYPEEQFALQTLKLGASGYLTKQEAADELLTAIEKCLAGERYLSSSFSSLLISQVLQHCKAEELPHTRLSRREMEIFRLLARGYMLKRIANDLGLSIKTVSTYKVRLSAKMGFKDNAALIRYAVAYQLN